MGLFGIARFLFVRSVEIIVVLTLIVIMPNIPPDGSFSTPYKLSKSIPFEGKLALNERLNNVELWHAGDFVGAEAFAEYNGELYTGIHGGDIVKLVNGHITPVVKFGKPCKGLYEEKICGRPLGLAFDKNGALYAADAYYGIYKVNVKTGDKVQLIGKEQKIGGVEPKLFNSVAIADNGDIYWTDSSSEFALEDGLFDMLSDGSGRLIHYNSRTKENTVLIEKLHFANGLVLTENEDSVVVAETGRCRLHKYHLKGPKKGTHEVLIDGLPGLPDNLKSDGQGGIFVPLVVATDEEHPLIFQSLGQFPRLRKLAARMFGLFELMFKLVDRVYPNEASQKIVHFIGHFTSMKVLTGPKRVSILHISTKGEILDSVHTTNGKIDGISEVHIHKDYVLLGSPFNDYIARVPLASVGWKHLAPAKQMPTTAPKPTTQKPTTTTPKPTTTTPKPTTTTPEPTTQKPTTQKPTTQKPTTQKPTTTQRPTTTTQKPTTQKPTTTPPPTATPKPTAQKPQVVPQQQAPPQRQATPQQATPQQAPPQRQAPPQQQAPPQRQAPPQQQAAPKQAVPQQQAAPKQATPQQVPPQQQQKVPPQNTVPVKPVNAK